MNLKEAFRYQNFLGKLLNEAIDSIQTYDHCLKCEKKHLRAPVEEDIVEVVDRGDFHDNNTMISFICYILNEKAELSDKIAKAKASAEFDIDGAIAVNKSRQAAVEAIRYMLRAKPKKVVSKEGGFKINNEGNQTPYYYKVESVYDYDYDVAAAKDACKRMSKEADKMSSNIDNVMVNTVVDYDPPFDIGSSFDDVVEEFKFEMSTF